MIMKKEYITPKTISVALRASNLLNYSVNEYQKDEDDGQSYVGDANEL